MNLSHNGLNFNSFTNANQILEKGEKVTMDKQELINEHKKLVNVLDSESHEDDKEESKEQAAELKKLEKAGLWENVDAKRKRGEKPAKPGDKDYPEEEAFNEASKDVEKADDVNISEQDEAEQKMKLNNLLDNKHEVKKSDSNELSGSISKETLVKSHIGYQFSNSENLTIDKKGSQIKEKLLSIKDKLSTGAAMHQAKMEALRQTIPTAPTDKMDGYVSDGIDVNSIPAVYNWGETYYSHCESPKIQSETVITEGENATPVKSQEEIICESKREYNRCAERFISLQAEIKLIDTMVNNLEDNKTYKLVVKQAAILGF